MKSYRDVNGYMIDLDKIFTDFNITPLEIDIITILTEGHWLICKVITKIGSSKIFVKEFEKIPTSNRLII